MHWGDGWAVLLLFAGCVAAFVYTSRPLGSAVEMQKAHPDWKVHGEGYSPIPVDDGSAAGEILVGGDDATPYRVERIDCAEMSKAFPA